MEKAVQYFADQLVGIYRGVTPGLIDTVRVEAYGSPTPIKHLASTAQESGRVAVVPYDPNLVGAIDKALRSEGFNSYILSKTTVIVSTPQLNVGGREKAVAQIGKLEEEAKVAVRNIRKKSRQKLKLPNEELQRAEKTLQDMTDVAIIQIATLARNKVDSL